MSSWIEVKAKFAKAPEDWSVFIDCFDKHGCPGTQQFDDPPMLVGYLTDVQGADDRLALLSEALFALGVSSVENTTIPEENWSELWKQHFKPRRVGQRFVVRPTWEKATLRSDDIELVLDPGQAFGTGDHQTTRLSLMNLERVKVHGKTLLDLGCGSGILAIAACKLGARVTASDIDPQSVEVSRENMVRNQVKFDLMVKDGFPEGGPWEIVISNIISATLIRFAARAYEAVAPGGKWIVSGVIEANWPDVKAAAEKVGFTLESFEQEDEWIGAIFSR